MSADDPLSSGLIPVALREALRLSPDNPPLLLHVAETVLKQGGFAEAEALFKRALSLDPESMNAKLGLASVFFQQGKSSAALVIVESVIKQPAVPPRAYLLHARLALQAGEPRLAAQQYAKARDADASLADGGLEQDLTAYLPRRPEPVRAPTKAPSPPTPSAGEESEENTSNPFSSDEIETAEALPAGDLPSDSTIEVERPTTAFADVGGRVYRREYAVSGPSAGL